MRSKAAKREATMSKRKPWELPGWSHPFHPGMAVKLSAEGLAAGMQGRAKRPTGVVTCVHLLDRLGVRVRRYGQKTSIWYHVDFWEATMSEPMTDERIKAARERGCALRNFRNHDSLDPAFVRTVGAQMVFLPAFVRTVGAQMVFLSDEIYRLRDEVERLTAENAALRHENANAGLQEVR